MFRVRSIAMLLMPVLVSGCLYLPIIQAEPFGEEVTKPIKVGSTTLWEVLARFGAPKAAHRQDRVLVYRSHQLLGVLIIGGPYQAVALPLSKPYFLVMEFDEAGVVRDIERITIGADKGPSDLCTKSNVCFADRDAKSIFASQAEDSSAKRFEARDGECAIYVYYDGARISLAVTPLFAVLDGRLAGPVPNNGFLRWRVPAGRHRVATWRYYPVQVPGVPHRLGSVELHCRAGDTKFLRNAMPYSLFAKMTVTLSQVDAETGRKAIHARTLVVDRLWQNPSGRGKAVGIWP